MAIIARENPYAKKARVEESSLGPRQPDVQICAGCDDGLSQSIGNFPVLPGGGRSKLCKLHHNGPGSSNGQSSAKGATAPLDGAYAGSSPAQAPPFVATDEDVDYLRPQDSSLPTWDPPRVGVVSDGPDAVMGVVIDHGGYEPTPPAHLARVADLKRTLDVSDAHSDGLEELARLAGLVHPNEAALNAVPVPAGTIEKLARNQNADVMVRSLAGLVARLEALPAHVTTDEEQGTVALLLTQAAEEERNIEALRESIKAPYLHACKTIDAAMGAASVERRKLATARARAAQAIGAYQSHRAAVAAREAEEARQRAVQAAEAEAEAVARAAAATTPEERHRALLQADNASLAQVHATMDAADAETQQKGVRTDAGSLSFTAPWEVEVIAPMLVPREFLSVDMVKLRGAVRAGWREIPGCVISQGHGLRMGR